MRSAALLGAIMAVGCAAVPLDERALKVVEVVDVVTVTMPAGQPIPTPTPTPAAAPAAPVVSKVETTVSSAPPAGFLETEPSATPAAAPAPAPAPSASSSSSITGTTSDDQAGMLSVVNSYRSAYGLNQLSWNSALDANVAQVGKSNGGVNEVHALIPGMAMGQVISPGQSVTFPSGATPMSPFEIAYLAWLCEVPSDPQLQASANNGVNVCDVMQSILHMDYDGETGHHAILVSPDYTGISCGFTANPSSGPTETYQGIWVCDLSQ